MTPSYWLNLLCIQLRSCGALDELVKFSKLPGYSASAETIKIPDKVVDLKDVLRRFHCKVSGNKKDLLKRVGDLCDLGSSQGYKCAKMLLGRYLEVSGIKDKIKIKKPERPGYIYCIKFNEFVKIGLSRYTEYGKLVKYLHRRYKTPYGFTELSAYNFKCKYFEKVTSAEREIHNRYKDLRFNNSELFKIDFGKVEL